MPSGPRTEVDVLFTYKLELADGTPAHPQTFHTAVSRWEPGDVIPLGPGRTLRVVDVRPAEDAVGDPTLTVEAA